MNNTLQCVVPYRADRFRNETIFLMLFLLITSLYALPLQAEESLKHVSVSIMVNNATVRQTLNVLEKQSDYKFFYGSEQFNTRRRLTLNFHGNMDEALQLIMGNDVAYAISGKHIILKKKLVSAEVIPPDEGDAQPDSVETLSAEPKVTDQISQPPDLVISGVVKDDQSGPLPGVNVILKGTSTGTTTDQRGIYTISVPDVSAVLVFSFIGYKTIELPVGNQTTLDVSLQPDEKTLEEVVVVGYGAVKKSDLTGAVSSISRKDIGDRQVSDLASLIQGRAAGVDVSQGKIRIRGITSFNNTDPLIVIDGFIGGNVSTVNANDIENIEILKDASSTAIYGSRGANGVILVTTKMGKKGSLGVNLKYYEGLNQVPKKLDLMNANQYTDYVLDLLGNSSINPTPKLLSGETRVDRTDWQDEIFRTSHNRELNADVSGGSENASFFLSLGYRHTENPTYMGRKDDLFYLRSRNAFDIGKFVKFGNNFAFSYNTYTGGGEAGNPGNLDHPLNAPQYIPVYDANGNFSVTDRNSDIIEFAHPLTTAVHNQIEGNGIDYQAALWAEIEPLKGLTYKIQAGVSGDFAREQYSNDSYTGGIAGTATLPAKLTKTYYYSVSPLIEHYITYRNVIGQHDFSVMVGNTWQQGVRNGRIGVRGQDLDPTIQNVLTATTNLVTEDAIGKYAYLSYFGRVNYQFANKYLLTVNLRSDASPKFAPGNRWGTFPSVAVAWKLHEENFLKSSDLFDQLKLRVAWGRAGNDAIGDFKYVSQVYNRNVYYPFGPDGTRVNGATVLNNSAPDIRWESTEAKSLGIDMAVLSNKLNLSADYYIKETSDILYGVPRAVSLGYGDSGSDGSAIVNAASMENKGIELQIGYRSNAGKLNYSVNANFTHNKNEVTSLGEGSYLDGINRTDIGNPIGYFYGYIADGVFMSQQELDQANAAAQAKGYAQYQLATTTAGDVRFVDLNGDGHVDNEDRTKIGSPHPVNSFGLNVNLDYKGFDFNIFLQGITGSEIYDGNYDRTRGGNYVLNQSTYVLDRWQDESNQGNGNVPRAVIGDPAQNNRVSTLKLTNGNFMKLRTVSLGYTLPSTLVNNVGLKNVRFYLSAYNILTLSHYDYGYDPEVGGDNLSRGIDNGNTFPRPKMVMLGVQVSL